jgi:AraC-like DNA-binding protein
MLPQPNPTRLDRLSALLQAAAPAVVVGPATELAGNLSNTLLVQLLATQGHAPHSVCVGQSQGAGAGLVTNNDAPPPDAATLTMQVHLNGPAAPMLMREFAQPMVLPLAGADAALTQAVQLLCSELATPRCGQPAMLASAGNMLFIGLLRHLVAHPQASSGLFVGLGDPRLAAALVAMHEQPQTAWTLALLADRAGMSRTAFATHFKEAMRTPPGKYLAQLRLQIAQRAVKSGKGLKAAARESGYKDVSALSRALGRVHGRTRALPSFVQ